MIQANVPALYCYLMDNTYALPHRPRQAAGIGISLAVHAMLLAMWQLSRTTPALDTTTPEAMVVRLLSTPSSAPSSEPAPAGPARETMPSLRRGATPAAAQQPPVQAAGMAPPVGKVTAEAPAEAAAAEAAPTVASDVPAPAASGSMLERARAAAGGADRALRKENPTRGIVAPVVTAQMKLSKGIAEAADLVPNKWYEAPKVTEVLDPGGYGRRRYRVVGAAGTYCVTYESNHAPDGLDTMRDGIKPKKTTCDPDWGPATTQKWN